MVLESMVVTIEPFIVTRAKPILVQGADAAYPFSSELKWGVPFGV